MIGKRFGKWTVIKESPKPKQECKYYLCECDCGNRIVVSGTSLRLGKSTRCRECAFYKHGMVDTPIYKIWGGMRSRCNNPKVKIYKYYGGRGIKVCSRWNDFKNFYKDMGDRPPGLQLDRINNNGGYEPSNCKWVTSKENNPSNKGDLKDEVLGKKFGKWKVLYKVKHKPKHRYYFCRCECGTERVISGGELRRKGNPKCKKCAAKEHRGWYERFKSRGSNKIR